MLKTPPLHRTDAVPTLVLFGDGDGLHDDAWDMERIDKERTDVAEVNKTREKGDRLLMHDHPVEVYRRGDTRMDIDAEAPWRGNRVAASSYLKADAEATRFVLRRLSWDEYYDVVSLQLQSQVKACARACKIGLVSANGFDLDEDRDLLSHAEMQTLFDVSPNLAIVIGRAVLAASQPLRADEKKL